MKTPSSLRRLIRSQASIKTQKAKKEVLASRSALCDITNDSPIIGVAKEKSSIKTPKSSAAENRVQACQSTPGSGESLLRGRVKNLLQKVEEEAGFLNNNKIALEERPSFRVLLDLPAPSPVQVTAPTPANTPQVLQMDAGVKNSVPIKILEPVVPEQTVIVQEESTINRTLLFDSPNNSESTDISSSISSTLSYQGSGLRSCAQKSPEDDSSSAWSLQVNVSLKDEDEEETVTDFDGEDEEGDEGCYEEDDESLDDICDGLSRIRMKEEKVELPEFEGKHTRFVYDSDGEDIKGQELIVCDKVVPPNAVILRGLPVPEGKHLRFPEEEDEEN